MKFIISWRSALVALLLVFSACSDSHQNLRDKSTNWLRSCEESSTCGTGLHCVCGVCTSVCDRDAECADYGETAICSALGTSDSACPSSTGASADERVCVLSCAHDATCSDTNQDLMCGSQGACVPAPKHSADASTSDPDAASAETDASMARGDAEVMQIPDATIPDTTPPTIDPELESTLTAACGAGFSCVAAAGATGRVTRLAAGDDGFVYWTDWGSLDDLGNHRKDGAVMRADKNGGAPEAVVTGLEKPWQLWLDSEQMYWLSGEPGDFGLGRGLQTFFQAPRDASAPAKSLKTNAFAHVQRRRSTFMWLESRKVDTEMRLFVMGWSPRNEVDRELQLTGVADPDSLVLDGIDQYAAYLEDGSLRILRAPFNSDTSEEIATDPPLFLATVTDDALWLIHTDDSNRDWVASMPTAGGSVTHLASADGYYDRPQPGTNVVWLVTAQPGNASWQLWSIPKAGGEREAAFSWPTQSGLIRDDAPAPIWIADGDDAWVLGHGTLVRVRARQQQ